MECMAETRYMDPELYKDIIFNKSSHFIVKDVHLKLESTGNTILHVAAKSGELGIAQKIIESYPSLLQERNMKGNTPLHIAASLGFLEMTTLLLECAEKKNSDIEEHKLVQLLKIQNNRNETAFHAAVRNGHYKIVDLLIKKDQSLTSIINVDKESPLFMAVDRGFFKIADLILGIQECSEYGGSKGMNALHAAAIRMHPSSAVSFLKDAYSSLIVILFSLGDSFHLPDRSIDSSNRRSEHIKKRVCVEFVGRLLKKFPKAIGEEDDFGWTPLHYAAHFGRVEIVKTFLDKNNSHAYKRNKEGMCALHISAKEGHAEVMDVIIKRCPYACELLDNRHRTALHLAVESGKKAAVKTFLKQLAFRDLMNEQDDEGNTPFHIAATKGHYALLMMMANYRIVDLRDVNKKQKTILDIIQSDNRLMPNEKDTLILHLKRRNVLQSLKIMVDTEATKVRTPVTKGDGQLIHEVRAETEAANFSEKSDKEDVKDMANFTLLVSTIIATVTFAAAFQVPGGYNDNGLAILSKNDLFTNFLIYDSLAFGFSSVSIFVNFAYPFLAKAVRLTYPMVFSLILTELSVICMVVAFIEGTKSFLADKSWLPNAVYSSLIPISYFLLRPIIERTKFLYSDKTRKLPWYL